MPPSADTIPGRRLVSHQLCQPRWRQAERALDWMVAVQAQDYDCAKWSVGLRLRDTTSAAVEEAIVGRRIVRTWALRGTLHFVAAADVSWLIPLIAPGIIAANARRYRELELDDRTFARSNAIISRILAGGGCLTRSAIVTVLEDARISATGQRAPYLLQRAALDGVICHGLRQGHEPTYVLLSEWIGAPERLDRAEALAELASRYFAAHGPATVRDFAWWAGLSATSARQAAESAGSVVRLTVDGREYLAAASRRLPAAQETAHLLPPFDSYLLGYKDRSSVLDPIHAREVNRGGGMPKPTIILDGRVIGTWGRSTRDGRVVVRPSPFRPLQEAASAAVLQAARRYAAFTEMQMALE